MGTTEDRRERRRRTKVALGGFVGSAALTAVAMWWGGHHIDTHLRDETIDELNAAGIGQFEVDFDGRDGEVVVPEGTDVAALRRRILDITDVRRLTIRTSASLSAAQPAPAPASTTTTTAPAPTTTEAAEPALVEPQVEMTTDGTTITVTGTVTAEQHDLLIDGLIQTYGADNVIDELTIVDGASNDQINGTLLAAMVDASAMSGLVVEGSVTVDNLTVTRSGVAVDQRAAEVLNSADAIEGVPISGTVTVAEPDVVTAANVSFDGATVTLTGTLTEGQHDQLLLAVGAAYPDAAIDDQIEIVDGGDTGDADVDRVDDVLAILSGRVLDAEVDLDGAVITVTSTATSAAAAAELDEQLADIDGVEATVDEPSDEQVAEQVNAAISLAGIQFASGSAAISPESTAVLDQAAQVLLDNPTVELEVQGHTDNQGSAAGNQQLSEQRAQAVVDYLVSAGIDSARLTAVGFGDSQPIADNSTNQGRQTNRRIEFVVKGN